MLLYWFYSEFHEIDVHRMHISIQWVSFRYSSDVNRLHIVEFNHTEEELQKKKTGSILRCCCCFYLLIWLFIYFFNFYFQLCLVDVLFCVCVWLCRSAVDFYVLVLKLWGENQIWINFAVEKMGNFPSNAHCIKYRSKLPYVLNTWMYVCADGKLFTFRMEILRYVQTLLSLSNGR